MVRRLYTDMDNVSRINLLVCKEAVGDEKEEILIKIAIANNNNW